MELWMMVFVVIFIAGLVIAVAVLYKMASIHARILSKLMVNDVLRSLLGKLEDGLITKEEAEKEYRKIMKDWPGGDNESKTSFLKNSKKFIKSRMENGIIEKTQDKADNHGNH